MIPSPSLSRPALRWIGLGLSSVVLVVFLERLHFPAALLLGPMLAAVAFGLRDAPVHVPRRIFMAAQGILGMMMATSIPPDFLLEAERHWVMLVSGTLFTVLASAMLGYVMTRARLFPGTTAIWGSSPGAATPMVLMSGDYGADMRLVAFMQYLRVACCALVSGILARVYGLDPAAVPQMDWFPPTDWGAAGTTVALALAAGMIAPRLRIPGGGLLGALLAGLAMQAAGIPVVLHPVLLACSFAVIGCTVGLRFTREVVRHAARAFPSTLASIATLIALCAAFGFVLHAVAGIDLLTALLATSPGGADTVAIIAASSAMDVDVAFVMTMQVARFLFVALTAPALARFLSRRAGG